MSNMKSKVYLIRVSEGEAVPAVAAKLKRLLGESRVLDFIRPNTKVALKMHFGEDGNTGFVRPEYLRVVCAEISDKKANPSVADTNTLYKGRRTNSADHMALAAEHGFSRESIGAEVVVPDDNQKENNIDVQIGQEFIKSAKLARFFVVADALIGVSHFKGHIMTGFGGALKNLGMGCAARVGKLQQHSNISPIVYQDKCTGCGECAKSCPVDAITIENNKSVISSLKCIGCATCIAVCPFMAIDVPWASGADTIQQKMIEYTSAVMKNKKGKLGFLNFAVKITKECDCLAKDDPRVAPDIGILASDDPVSIDKASLDLVNEACGRDIFREMHPERDGMIQLKYAEQLGLGSLGYELIEIK